MLRNMIVFLFIFLSYPAMAHYPLDFKSGILQYYGAIADSPCQRTFSCISNLKPIMTNFKLYL
ncbi:hypothetical protein BDD26_2613 [Xenorhabdus cabanillasii]|uniref:Uncharacterized protein n=1 Tax=Xenorhabdus cabanillasii TaxID=351673 RepID=A0A3D9UE82_9GAMM|nr:hypothetical protein Xcab_01556 [Xenorhabdus cabanillasii JM26]REF27792.1 hypothetical protein BDD26_2613 [Xenorhabdus cabanillasii]